MTMKKTFRQRAGVDTNIILRMSHGTQLRTSDDAHMICDKSWQQINHAESVLIEEHNWLCQNATILKGAVIKSGCVVATGAIVTKCFHEKNAILRGIPAKVLKTDISWFRELLLENDLS